MRLCNQMYLVNIKQCIQSTNKSCLCTETRLARLKNEKITAVGWKKAVAILFDRIVDKELFPRLLSTFGLSGSVANYHSSYLCKVSHRTLIQDPPVHANVLCRLGNHLQSESVSESLLILAYAFISSRTDYSNSLLHGIQDYNKINFKHSKLCFSNTNYHYKSSTTKYQSVEIFSGCL